LTDLPPNEPDPRTLDRFRKGDLTALAAVFKLYGTPVYRLARRMMGNQADAEDATQEIFLRAFEQADKFHGRSSLFTWLYRLAARHCLNKLKRRRRRDVREHLSADGGHWAHQETAPSPLEHLVVKEQSEFLDALLRSLPPNYRACILLREVQGLSYAGIAEHLEIPIGTVMSRLARARQVLRERLQQSEENRTPPGITPAGGLSNTLEERAGDGLR
jgi:RNA polymerase sigma-70 factor (ECF subfamily)